MKICDFGQSKIIKDYNVSAQTHSGTLNYMAHEVINKNESTISSDIWTLGVIIYQICTGKVHFNDYILSFSVLLGERPTI